jgi:hypothetical protein
MGQQVVALMYGISSKTKGLSTEEGDWLWDDFRDGTPDSKRLKHNDEKAPRSAYEGGVLGFAVASGPARNSEDPRQAHQGGQAALEVVRGVAAEGAW